MSGSGVPAEFPTQMKAESSFSAQAIQMGVGVRIEARVEVMLIV